MPPVNGVGEPCAGERMHGSMRRGLETENPAMVTQRSGLPEPVPAGRPASPSSGQFAANSSDAGPARTGLDINASEKKERRTP